MFLKETAKTTHVNLSFHVEHVKLMFSRTRQLTNSFFVQWSKNSIFCWSSAVSHCCSDCSPCIFVNTIALKSQCPKKCGVGVDVEAVGCERKWALWTREKTPRIQRITLSVRAVIKSSLSNRYHHGRRWFIASTHFLVGNPVLSAVAMLSHMFQDIKNLRRCQFQFRFVYFRHTCTMCNMSTREGKMRLVCPLTRPSPRTDISDSQGQNRENHVNGENNYTAHYKECKGEWT